MKSQVNALLLVTQGILKDASATYPALKEEFIKDSDRLALYCQTRGLGLFTLDLPYLESLLLRGLEDGRLMLKGPLSSRVSKRTQVPRLFSGLWLRVFDKCASLKQDVDVTALAFLRQLLTLGKRLELGCSHDRISAVVRAYHDIERQLRSPSLGWSYDSLINDGADRGGFKPPSQYPGHRDLFLPHETHEEVTELSVQDSHVNEGVWSDRLSRLHLVQANDGQWDTMPLARGLRETAIPSARAEDTTAGVVSGGNTRDTRIADQRLLYQIQQVADLIIGSFDPLIPLLYSEELEREGRGIGFKHGPGAVAERLKNWEKSRFQNWPAKLQKVFPFESCGKTAGSDAVRPRNHEVASRLMAVPKTAKGPRLIAAEPTSNQWCQQLVWKFLKDQVRQSSLTRDFIDFSAQHLSGRLVLKSSQDRSLATVDLSSASDRLTCWTVERVFRSNPSILRALHAARTRYLVDEISEKRDFLKLRKFATQGTATTFPVQSIVFLCIALGASLEGHVNKATILGLRNQVRVFGDDIVVPNSGYVRLLRAMELLQLSVNKDKSYVNGHFRESCGTDGYLGDDVTPVRPRFIVADGPAASQAVVDTTNNLHYKGYWHASSACESLLPVRLRCRLRIVGPNAAGVRGLASYSGCDESHLVRRWNSRLHRYEVRVWSILDRPRKVPRDGFPAFLDFVSKIHNPEQARVVSEYADARQVRDGLRWEPSSCVTRTIL